MLKDEKNLVFKICLFLDKIFISLGIVLAIFFGYILVELGRYDGWNETISFLSLFYLPIALILPLWVPKKAKKGFLIVTGIALFITIANNIYNYNFKTQIETKIHLHKKYNYNYSDMKVIKTIKSDYGDIFGHGATKRSAIIKYQGREIFVYYDNGWKDGESLEDDY